MFLAWLLISLVCVFSEDTTDEVELTSFFRDYEYCPTDQCIAFRFKFVCHVSNACQIQPDSFKEIPLRRRLQNTQPNLSHMYDELVESLKMLESSWNLPFVGPLMSSLFGYNDTLSSSTLPPFQIQTPTLRPDLIDAHRQLLEDIARQPQNGLWDPFTNPMPPYYYHKLFDTVAKIALTDAIAAGLGWVTPLDMTTMPVNSASGTVALSAVPVLHPNILINGGLRRHPDEHEPARSGDLETVMSGDPHISENLLRSALKWNSEPAEWGRRYLAESFTFDSSQSKLIDLLSPSASQMMAEMARLAESVDQNMGFNEDITPQVPLPPNMPTNLRNALSSVELMNAVENKAVEFLLSMARPLVKAGSVGLAPSDELEGLAARLDPSSLWEKLQQLSTQTNEKEEISPSEDTQPGDRWQSPHRRLKEDEDLGSLLRDLWKYQMGQNEQKHTTSDNLPWVPLDSITGSLPAWFAEALVGPYALLFEDLVKVAQEAYVRMQLVFDAFADEPISVSSGSLQSFTNQISEAFRANLANDEANAIRSVALTVKKLPTFHNLVNTESNEGEDLGAFMSGYDAVINSLRKLNSQDPPSSELRAVEGILDLIGQGDTKYDSDTLPWLPLDSVVASYGGFLADKTGATGDLARKVARAWAKGSEKLDEMTRPLMQPLLSHLTNEQDDYHSTFPRQDDNVIRSAPRRQQRYVKSAGQTMTDQEFAQFFTGGWMPDPKVLDLPVENLLPGGQFVEEISHDIADLPSWLSDMVHNAVQSAPKRRLQTDNNVEENLSELEANADGHSMNNLFPVDSGARDLRSNEEQMMTGQDATETKAALDKLIAKAKANKAQREGRQNFGDPIYENPALTGPIPGVNEPITKESMKQYIHNVQNYVKNPLGTVQQTLRDNYRSILTPKYFKKNGFDYFVMDNKQIPAKPQTTIYTPDQMNMPKDDPTISGQQSEFLEGHAFDQGDLFNSQGFYPAGLFQLQPLLQQLDEIQNIFLVNPSTLINGIQDRLQEDFEPRIPIGADFLDTIFNGRILAAQRQPIYTLRDNYQNDMLFAGQTDQSNGLQLNTKGDLQTFFDNIDRETYNNDTPIDNDADFVALPLPRTLTLDEIAADPEAINRAVSDYLTDWQHYIRVMQGVDPGRPQPINKIIEDIVRSFQTTVETLTNNEFFQSPDLGVNVLFNSPDLTRSSSILEPTKQAAIQNPASLKKIMYDLMDNVSRITNEGNRQSTRMMRRAADTLGMSSTSPDRFNLLLLPLLGPQYPEETDIDIPLSSENSPQDSLDDVPMGSILPAAILDDIPAMRRRLSEWTNGSEDNHSVKELQSVIDMFVNALHTGYDTIKTEIMEASNTPVATTPPKEGLSGRAKTGAANLIQRMADGIVNRGPNIKDPEEEEAFTEDVSAYEKIPSPETRRGRNGSVMPDNSALFKYIHETENDDHLHIPQRSDTDKPRQPKQRQTIIPQQNTDRRKITSAQDYMNRRETFPQEYTDRRDTFPQRYTDHREMIAPGYANTWEMSSTNTREKENQVNRAREERSQLYSGNPQFKYRGW